jgi:pimeloyl-ACP methyl ester carboxylesterase
MASSLRIPGTFASWMQPLIEHRLQLAGFSTRALELEGEGPPVVLLHGYADSADTWRNVLDRLARRDRRALAVDLPGFGAADPLRREGSMLEQLDAFARAAVVHAAAEGGDVVLAGNSLGGCVALRVAEDETAPLAGVVPIAPAGLDMPGWFRIIERDPFVRLILSAPVPLPEPLLRGAVGAAYRQLAFADPRGAAREAVRAFTDHHRTKDRVVRILENGRRLLPELSPPPFRLERIGCPVLLIWGDRDRMVTHKGARLITEALPATDHRLLEGVGHCPQVEAPDRVAALLLDFLADPSEQVA